MHHRLIWAHLVRNAKHDDSSSVIVIEIDSFRDFTTSDRQQNGTPAIITRLKKPGVNLE